MAQLLFSLAFLAIATVAIRMVAHELRRPLAQPWLHSGFGGVDADGARTISLTDRRLRRDIIATARRSSSQPLAAAA